MCSGVSTVGVSRPVAARTCSDLVDIGPGGRLRALPSTAGPRAQEHGDGKKGFEMVAQVAHAQGMFTGVGGVELFWQSWTPDAPRAAVVLVHGMGEHSGRYAGLIEVLTGAGLAVFAHDHRGHGRSAGRRAHIARLDDLVTDIGRSVARARTALPDVPLVVLGHSMGGLTSALWAQANPDAYDLLALSGPLAALDGANAATRAAARLLSTLAPTLPLIAVDADELSHDPQVGADYRADPLVHAGKLSARTVYELAAGVTRVQRGAPRLRRPLSIQHGALDSLAPPRGSAELYAAAAAQDKRRIVYPGMFHEIFNEVGKEEVFADLRSWLLDRIG